MPHVQYGCVRVACMQARKLRKAEAELQAAHGAQVAAVLEKFEGLRASVQQYHAQLAQVPLSPLSVLAHVLLTPAGRGCPGSSICCTTCCWHLHAV